MLRNYRATPHTTTGMPPATLLLGRILKVKIPDKQSPNVPNELVTRSQVKKDKMNEYVSKQRHACDRPLRVGDLVLVKQRKVTKSTPLYEPTAYRIVGQKGTLISARNTKNDHVITTVGMCRSSSEYHRKSHQTVINTISQLLIFPLWMMTTYWEILLHLLNTILDVTQLKT